MQRVNNREMHGFTLVEIIVVIGIIIILLAIMSSSLVQATRSAKVTATATRLRQIWTALSLYRSENGGDTSYGFPSDMGLPERSPYGEPAWFKDPPPCGYHPFQFKTNFYLMCLCNVPEGELLASCRARVSKNVQTYKEDWILLVDDNCTDPNVNLFNKYQEKRAVGVLLGGSLKVRHSTGNHLDPSWWATAE
ncbi:MAG: prepilin-type N-terminal cleavage/methylation domain-containing protein [Armatimonadetes bacterium]|nr:prepilin-type N-terminal cleavage/methylation domain-containing protein [Armatimonadota bacterium]